MCFFTNLGFLMSFKRRNSLCSAAILIFIWSGQMQVYASTVTYCATDTMHSIVYNKDELKCVNCSTCPIGHEEVSPCTRTSDTQCRPCPEGTFNNGMYEMCQNCSRCGPGFYFIQKCNSTDDVTCDTCAEGMFTESYNNRVCRGCKACSINEITIEKCTSRRNTQCGNCVRDHFRDDATSECVPCSYCHPNLSVIVRECQDKLGHSQEVCLPLGYVPRSAQGTVTMDTTWASTMSTSFDQSYTEIAIGLAGVVLTVIFILIITAIMYRKRSTLTFKIKRNNIKKRRTNTDLRPLCLSSCCVKDSNESPEEFLMKDGTINTQTSEIYSDAESGYLSMNIIRSTPSESLCTDVTSCKMSFGETDWVPCKQSEMKKCQENKGNVDRQNIEQKEDTVSKAVDSAVDVDVNISSIQCIGDSCRAHAHLPRLDYMGVPVDDDISKNSAQ